VLALLRQRRYLGLIALCVVVAALCGLAGSWQVLRFDEKRTANHELRTNDRQSVDDIASVLGKAASQTSSGRAQEFRHVRASGTYLPDHQTLVRGQTVNDSIGFLVLTPLATDDGVLLVVRGFVEQTGPATETPSAPAPPSGHVEVSVRLEPGSTRNDRYGSLPSGQVEQINPAQQAARLAQPVWNAYGELLAAEPGTQGLTVIPNPDMSNPAGGAVEPQHAAYVVQWFLFGAMALAVPFVMARAEHKRSNGPGDKPSLDDRLAGNV